MDSPRRDADSASAQQRRHYDRVGEGYDRVRKELRSMRRYYRRIDDLMLSRLPAGGHGRVLDDLCGSGDLLPSLCARFSRVAGIDISENMLRRVDRKLRAGLCCGDALALPFADGVFDAVAVRGGLHHVPDYPRALREIYRVLAAGGVFVAHEPCDDNPAMRFLRWCVYRLSPALDARTEKGLLTAGLAANLRAAGFREVAISTYGSVGYLLCGNPDVLTWTRVLDRMPGATAVTGALIAFDDWIARSRALSAFNLTLIAVARK